MFSKFVNEKFILVFVWCIILGINTLTANLEALIRFHIISFEWDPSPHLRSFFNFQDISKIHSHVLIVKLGHFLGFAILDVLFWNWVRNHKWSLAFSIFFALLTEVLQLFFGRDGRLYDLLIDTAGALTVYFVIKKGSRHIIYSHFDR